MTNEQSLDLERGDFLYQVDQELFLVVSEVRDDSYLFSVHGWRDIDKERVAGYVNGEPGKLHDEETFESVVDEKADDETTEQYKELKELFRRYAENEGEALGDTFAMEDKE